MTWRQLAAWAVLAILLVGLSTRASAGDVRAFVDRDTVALGETVTLNVEASDLDSAQAPDFDVLVPDFVILGRNSQQNFSNVNGSLQRSQIWAVALQPRREGTLTIPAFEVGGERTTPIRLSVTAASNVTAQSDAFIEYDASPSRVWVGQEVLLRVRLFYAGRLAQGQLDEPASAHADLRKLGDDLQYQAERGGRRYNVVERRYALFAREPGTLDLPPLDFRGQMQTGAGGAFFGNSRVVSASSTPITLHIDAMPDHGAGPWLPARHLELTLDGVPASGKATVGTPVTLTLAVKAEGLPFDALPEPSLPAIDGAAVYPDKPADLTRNDGEWLTGSRERKFAVVPTRAGSLTIPPISIDWWNTTTGKRETITLPAHTLEVAAGAGVATPPAADGMPDAATVSASSPIATTGNAADVGTARGWRLAALGLFALWVATLLAWTWQRRRSMASATVAGVVVDPSVRACERAFRQSRDAGELGAALLAWARAERPSVHNLGELAAQLDDMRQREVITALEQHRFGAGAALEPDMVIAAFRYGLAWRATPQDVDDKGLPPLYPRR